MLLVVNHDYGGSIAKVWDTDDMSIESIDKYLLFEHIRNGDISVQNVVGYSNSRGSVDYSIKDWNVFPVSSPVILGCGDIWYGKYVWHALTGCMFEINHSIYAIYLNESRYTFSYMNNGSASFVYSGIFPIRGLGIMPSEMHGMTGQDISREDFMKKVVIGGI